jgi:hypothetical protein
MFFFNGRIRNAHIVPMITPDPTYTQKIGQSFVVFSCLSIVIGLLLIVIGHISETEKWTFFGFGIISLSLGLFLVTLVCFYSQLSIYYHNWAYGSHITPSNTETGVMATAGDVRIAYVTVTTPVVRHY